MFDLIRIRNYFCGLFFLIANIGFSQQSDFWNIDFSKADSIAFRYHNFSLKNPDALTDSLVVNLATDVEKFRAIFRWITDNIRYDYEMYLRTVNLESQNRFRQRKNSSSLTRLSRKKFRRTIRKKTAVCSGYSMLLEYMSNHADIPCEIVEGYARTYNSEINGNPNHAWNVVHLSGKWYLADATWASGFVDPDVGRFFKKFNDIYFLPDPALLISNHYPKEKQWTLLKDPPALSSFRNAPLKPEGFIKNKINRYSPLIGSINQKIGESIKFTFTSNAASIGSKVLLIITKPKYREEVEVELQHTPTGEYVIEHQFKEKGNYDVYIKINRQNTFVYRINVK